MFSKNELIENRSIIVEMVKRHRDEMELLSSTAGELFGGPKAKEYYEYSKTLSDEELVGVYSTAIGNIDILIQYCEILDGESSYEEFIEKTMGTKMLQQYKLTRIVLGKN